MAEANVRTLVVPTAKAVMTLEELKAELVAEGATGVQRDIGPGGENLYPCMGTAGVYVNEPASKEQKLSNAAHVIEEGWPGSGRFTEIPGSNVHHHTVVPPHVFTADEMVAITDLASVANVYNVTPTKKLTKLAGAETDMLGDLKSNDGVEAIMLTSDTGIVVLFITPTHLLETMALIFDPLAATAITDTGTLTYSLDTTDGMNGTWHPIHGHIVDVSGMPSVAIDGKLPATIKPLMTNIEGVKAVKIFGPHLMVNLVELRFWVPKVVKVAGVPPAGQVAPTTLLGFGSHTQNAFGYPADTAPDDEWHPVTLADIQALGSLGETAPWAPNHFVRLAGSAHPPVYWDGTQWQAGAGAVTAPAASTGPWTPHWPGQADGDLPTGFTQDMGSDNPEVKEFTWPVDGGASWEPTNLAELRTYGSMGETAPWFSTEYVELTDHSKAYWDGTQWQAGVAP